MWAEEGHAGGIAFLRRQQLFLLLSRLLIPSYGTERLVKSKR